VLNLLINHEGDVQRLTPLAASRWKELLDYNKQDVLGLMYVMKRAKILAFYPLTIPAQGPTRVPLIDENSIDRVSSPHFKTYTNTISF
jgi:hypothetical protein